MTIYQRIKQIDAEYPALIEHGCVPDEFGEVPIDCFPSLNLKREYVTPCGHKIAAEESGIDWMDAVLLKERRRAEWTRR